MNKASKRKPLDKKLSDELINDKILLEEHSRQLLGLPENHKIVSLSPEKHSVKFPNTRVEFAVRFIEVRDEKGNPYHIAVNDNLDVMFTRNSAGKVELSDFITEELALLIGEKGKQTKTQKEYYDLDEHYFILEKDIRMYMGKEEMTEENRGIINSEEKEKQDEKQKSDAEKEKQRVAACLDIDPKSVNTVVRIEDEEVVAKMLDKVIGDAKYVDIIRYDGNHYKAIDDKGKEIAGLEYRELFSKIYEVCNYKSNLITMAHIKHNDLTVGSSEQGEYNLVSIRTGFSPEEQVILEQKADGTVEQSAFVADEYGDIQQVNLDRKYPDGISIDDKPVELKHPVKSNETIATFESELDKIAKIELILLYEELAEQREEIRNLDYEYEQVQTSSLDTGEAVSSAISGGIKGYAVGEVAENVLPGLEDEQEGEFDLSTATTVIGAVSEIDQAQDEHTEEKLQALNEIEAKRDELLQELGYTERKIEEKEQQVYGKNPNNQRPKGGRERTPYPENGYGPQGY